MTELELELWSNVVDVPRRTRRSITRSFVFMMGFIAGISAAGLAGHLLFG